MLNYQVRESLGAVLETAEATEPSSGAPEAENAEMNGEDMEKDETEMQAGVRSVSFRYLLARAAG